MNKTVRMAAGVAAVLLLCWAYFMYQSASAKPDLPAAPPPPPPAFGADLEPFKTELPRAASALREEMARDFPTTARKGVEQFGAKLEGAVTAMEGLIENLKGRYRDAELHGHGEEIERLYALSGAYEDQLKAFREKMDQYREKLAEQKQGAAPLTPPAEVFAVVPPRLFQPSDRTMLEYSRTLIVLGLGAQCFGKPELSPLLGPIGPDLPLFEGDTEARNQFLEAVTEVAGGRALAGDTRNKLDVAVREAKIPLRMLDHLANGAAKLPSGPAWDAAKASVAAVWKDLDDENKASEPKRLRELRAAIEKEKPLKDVKRAIAQPDRRVYFQSRDEQYRAWVMCAATPSIRETYWEGPEGLQKVVVRVE